MIETLDLGESCSASVVYTDLAGEGFVELIVSTLKGSIISVQTDLILNRRDYL